MKKIFAILGLALLLPALSARADDEWKPAEPIRMGKMRGSIMKDLVVRIPGGVSVSSELVCNFEAEIPVFDTRGKAEYITTRTNVTCDSVLQDKPLKVDVSGYWSYQTWQGSNPALNGDIKSVTIYLSPRLDSDEMLPKLQRWSYAATKDLSTRSLIVHASEAHSGSPDLPAREEMFSVTAELLDEAQ